MFGMRTLCGRCQRPCSGRGERPGTAACGPRCLRRGPATGLRAREAEWYEHEQRQPRGGRRTAAIWARHWQPGAVPRALPRLLRGRVGRLRPRVCRGLPGRQGADGGRTAGSRAAGRGGVLRWRRQAHPHRQAAGQPGWKKKPPGVILDSLMEGYDRPMASFLNAVRGAPASASRSCAPSCRTGPATPAWGSASPAPVGSWCLKRSVTRS